MLDDEVVVERGRLIDVELVFGHTALVAIVRVERKHHRAAGKPLGDESRERGLPGA